MPNPTTTTPVFGKWLKRARDVRCCAVRRAESNTGCARLAARSRRRSDQTVATFCVLQMQLISCKNHSFFAAKPPQSLKTSSTWPVRFHSSNMWSGHARPHYSRRARDLWRARKLGVQESLACKLGPWANSSSLVNFLLTLDHAARWPRGAVRGGCRFVRNHNHHD